MFPAPFDFGASTSASTKMYAWKNENVFHTVIKGTTTCRTGSCGAISEHRAEPLVTPQLPLSFLFWEPTAHQRYHCWSASWEASCKPHTWQDGTVDLWSVTWGKGIGDLTCWDIELFFRPVTHTNAEVGKFIWFICDFLMNLRLETMWNYMYLYIYISIHLSILHFYIYVYYISIYVFKYVCKWRNRNRNII